MNIWPWIHEDDSWLGRSIAGSMLLSMFLAPTGIVLVSEFLSR